MALYEEVKRCTKLEMAMAAVVATERDEALAVRGSDIAGVILMNRLVEFLPTAFGQDSQRPMQEDLAIPKLRMHHDYHDR